jgi:hydrogenase maturation factor
MDLRYGSADENVRKRSIRDVILHEGHKFEKVQNGFPSDTGFYLEAEPSLLCPSRAGELAVISAVNRLAAGGIRAGIFTPVILLPPGTQEDVLRELMRQICRTAFAHKIRIGEVKAEVTDAVTRPIVIGTAAGDRFCELCPAGYPAAGESDIILAGPVGMEGTYILVCEQFQALRERFSMSILARMKGLNEKLSVLPIAERAAEKSEKAGTVPVMVSLGEGGFFAGLWELSKKTGCGLDIDLQSVPLLQETIEITDFFGINPYSMRSAGSLLIAAADGKKIQRRLEEEGRIAVRIGKLTAGKEKIIRNGEDVRYLDRPQTDTLASMPQLFMR